MVYQSFTCPRCFGADYKKINKTVCPTCSGDLIIRHKAPLSSSYIPGFDLFNKIQYFSLDDIFELEDEGMVHQYFLFQEYFKKTYPEIKDWFYAHSLYPGIAELEEHLLSSGLINLKQIPGGPLRPEVILMSSDSPYHSYIAYTTAVEETINEKPINPTPDNVEQTTSRESKMNTKDKLREGGSRVAAAMRRGTVQGAVGAANRNVIATLENKLGESYPEALKTPAGRKAMEALIPSLLLMACSFDVENKLPGKKYIEIAADNALVDASSGAVSDLISVLLTELGPVLQAYQEAGHMLAEQPDFNTINVEAETVREVARESAFVVPS